MWIPTTLRAGRPLTVTLYGQISLAILGLLLPLLLSGCGGGGGGINSTSSSDQGFRIVPAGGIVTPLADGNGNIVSVTTSPNAVSTGVQMSVASADPNSQGLPTFLRNAPAVPPATVVVTTAPIVAYQITFNPDSPSVNAAAVLTLTYDPTKASPAPTVPANSTLRIYRYDAGVSQWIALPGAAVVPPATGAVTVTATMESLNPSGSPTLTPYLKSGLYAIFATAPPAAPTL